MPSMLATPTCHICDSTVSGRQRPHLRHSGLLCTPEGCRQQHSYRLRIHNVLCSAPRCIRCCLYIWLTGPVLAAGLSPRMTSMQRRRSSFAAERQLALGATAGVLAPRERRRLSWASIISPTLMGTTLRTTRDPGSHRRWPCEEGTTPAHPMATRHIRPATPSTRSPVQQSTLGRQLLLGSSTPYPCSSL